MAIFSKSNVPQFSVDVYQNEYLPEGGREVNAVVTVTATGGGTIGSAVAAPHLYSPGEGPSAAVVLMVDCSGSMDYPPTKMRNARDATAAAIDTLRDGVHFAVVGTHLAREVYPGDGLLAVAGPDTREQAKQALRKLSAGGGTAIGTWLRRADRLLASADVAIRHGILLTDGRNEHESPEDLKAALDACAGRFTCDARGVGTDWEVKEVTGIASALLGTADIVAYPAGLAADFTRMMETAMGKEVADVSLRLWTPAGATVTFVKQVAPTVEELTGRRHRGGPPRGRLPARFLGRRVPRLPPLRGGAARRRGPGDARGARLAGHPAARGQRAEPGRAGAGAGRVDGRPGRVDVDQPSGRPLHGSGRTGRSHPGGAGSAQSGRYGRSNGQAGPCRSARERLRQRRYCETACEGGGRRRRRDRYCATEDEGRGGRRDDTRDTVDQDCSCKEMICK